LLGAGVESQLDEPRRKLLRSRGQWQLRQQPDDIGKSRVAFGTLEFALGRIRGRRGQLADTATDAKKLDDLVPSLGGGQSPEANVSPSRSNLCSEMHSTLIACSLDGGLGRCQDYVRNLLMSCPLAATGAQLRTADNRSSFFRVLPNFEITRGRQ
jgi:hypothetical protein